MKKSFEHLYYNNVCIFRLGFEAPGNYNLSDFYIQTLAILPFDKERSLERVEVILTQQKKNLFINVFFLTLLVYL